MKDNLILFTMRMGVFLDLVLFPTRMMFLYTNHLLSLNIMVILKSIR